MIIVKLQGGAGNQMFQYAIGRNLALHYNTGLKLDTGTYSNNLAASGPENFNNIISTEKTTSRRYELDNFSIQAEIATENEIQLFRHQTNWLLRGRKFLTQSKYITESNYRFNPDYLKFGSNCYLNGYWQSEQYFTGVSEVIRNEFQFTSSQDTANLKMEALIKSSNSVSIHVRRGDYIHNPATVKFHGICSDVYYRQAVKFVSEKVQFPHFFIFSDDMDWVQQNLALSHPVTFVNINDENSAINDLRLMSRCQHHIIANSSFSWWSAWLNNYKDKIVVAPTKWFNDTSIDTSTVLPDKWYKF